MMQITKKRLRHMERRLERAAKGQRKLDRQRKWERAVRRVGRRLERAAKRQRKLERRVKPEPFPFECLPLELLEMITDEAGPESCVALASVNKVTRAHVFGEDGKPWSVASARLCRIATDIADATWTTESEYDPVEETKIEKMCDAYIKMPGLSRYHRSMARLEFLKKMKAWGFFDRFLRDMTDLHWVEHENFCEFLVFGPVDIQFLDGTSGPWDFKCETFKTLKQNIQTTSVACQAWEHWNRCSRTPVNSFGMACCRASDNCFDVRFVRLMADLLDGKYQMDLRPFWKYPLIMGALLLDSARCFGRVLEHVIKNWDRDCAASGSPTILNIHCDCSYLLSPAIMQTILDICMRPLCGFRMDQFLDRFSAIYVKTVDYMIQTVGLRTFWLQLAGPMRLRKSAPRFDKTAKYKHYSRFSWWLTARNQMEKSRHKKEQAAKIFKRYNFKHNENIPEDLE